MIMKDQFIPFAELQMLGLSLRFVVRNDIRAITSLIYEVCESEGDTATALTEEDLQNEWEYEGFDPEKDAFVVEDDQGKLAGYAAVYDINSHCELSGDIYVHPDYDVSQVGKALCFAMQKRAEEHALLATNKGSLMRVVVDNRNQEIKQLFIQGGYQAARYHWRMEIDLKEAPQVQSLPDRLLVIPFNWDQHAQAVRNARNAAFAGNWGSHALDLEEFSYYTKENPEYDASLWQVAWDGDQVAGFCINHMRMGIGWIHILGVIPEWRGMGVGFALLQRSFAEFYRRGTHVIGLGVDAANESGATRLYERIGMVVISEFVTLEKRFQ
jgi:mycothiol synthase